jgi:NAD(P)-dependent dehydrogenase (short-subunit alcohol dehydrogenase family)
VANHGGLQVAVNNAGIGGALATTDEYDVAEWRRVLSINLDGVFYCLRAELRHMLAAGGGAIVNTASIFSVVARDSMPAYTAAKHGVLGLTRAAAIDCVERGVRVNAVGPAVIRTPLLAASVDQETSDALAAINPSRRLGETLEVANVVAWLCSDEASFVTGAFYAVDGAFTAGRSFS